MNNNRGERAQRRLAPILATSGESRAHIAWFRNFGVKFLPPATLAVWVEGLRRAGLPEE